MAAFLGKIHSHDKVVNAFNEAMPHVKVQVRKKIGWKCSLAASVFSISAALSFILCYCILNIKTAKNHHILTKEEEEWRAHLEKKKLVSYTNAFGEKIEKKFEKHIAENISKGSSLCPLGSAVMGKAMKMEQSLNEASEKNGEAAFDIHGFNPEAPDSDDEPISDIEDAIKG